MTPPIQTPAALSAVPSTLRIPLAARALGAQIFPHMAVDDRHAAAALARLQDDGQQWLQDRKSIYGNLARTHCFRDEARTFLAQYPDATVFNLGCGLADYLQWLDNGRMQMVDADLPEVMAIRREIMPPQHARHRLLDADLCTPGWWEALGLPRDRQGTPACLICEGVLMYLPPATVTAMLRTFGEHAPAGSLLLFDAMCWKAVGRARHHASVRHTAAEFLWGPRRSTELAAAHPRLALRAEHAVMQGYSLPFGLMQAVFRALTGVPVYAVYVLGVD